MKKFLAISMDKTFLPMEGEIYTTEMTIARKVGNAKLIATCGYIDITEDTIQYLINVANKICSFIGEKLNKYHGVHFSQEEWRLLLLRDILALIQAVYERYQKLAQCKPEEFYTYGIRYMPITPPTGVWNGGIVKEYTYNTYIYSVICETLGFEIVYKEIKGENTSSFVELGGASKFADLSRQMKKAITNPKAALRWMKRKMTGADQIREIPRIKDCKSLLVRTRIRPKVEEEILHKHSGDIQRLEVGEFWRKTEEIATRYSVNWDLRKQLFDRTDVDSDDIFEKICFEIIPQSICVAALEAFKETQNEAERIAKYVKVKKIYTSGCMFIVCFLENLCGVYLRREGAKCYHIQHAVLEGLTEFDLAMIRAIGFDAELTWGWKRDIEAFEYKPRCITRTPEIGGAMPVTSEGKGRILIIAPPFEDYNNSFFDFSQMWEKYFEFLDCLATKYYPNVVVRVRDSLESEFCMEHRKYAGVRLETMQEISYEESVRKSNLIISTYYSSCHVEAMCAGVPCVMFECFDYHGINPALVGVVDQLKDIGILHSSGKNAAGFVSKLEDPIAWWSRVEVQTICAAYLETVIGDYKNLHQIWETEFIS